MTNSYFIQENCHTEKNPSTSYKSPKRRTLSCYCNFYERFKHLNVLHGEIIDRFLEAMPQIFSFFKKEFK